MIEYQLDNLINYILRVTFGLNPNRSLILSSGVKAIWLPLLFDEVSIILPRVVNFDLIVNG